MPTRRGDDLREFKPAMQELFKTGMELARSGYKWLKQPPELGHSIALN